jgi:chitodextrinase
MGKKIKKLQGLHSNRFSPVTLIIFIAVMVVAGYIIIFSKAAPAPPTIYLTPASQTIAGNTNITVQVRENSGTTPVNAVQANFSYPASLLTYVSMDTTGSAFGTAAQGTGGSGSVNIARGTSCNGTCSTLTGDQLIATVTFKSTTTSGTAALAFTTGTALVGAAAPNPNLLSSLAATGGASYVVDATGPTVSLTAPVNNSTVARDSTVSLTATATDSGSSVSKVDYYIDNSLVGTDTSTPYSFSWNTTGVALGAHTLQVKATDAVGNVSSSAVVNVTVADQSGPTVSITAPASGATVSGSAATVSANASDNIGVAGVQFKLDGANLGAEDTTAPYSVNWDTTTATSAGHTLTAVARDAAGNNTTSGTISVTVDNAAPTVSITAPTAGSSVSGTVAVNASAADNAGGSGIAKVEFYVDGALKSTDTTSPYSFSWDTSTAALGSHSLTAKAYDKATTANTATSSTVNVTVSDATPPSAPTNLHATNTGTTTVALAWGASTDNIGVTGYQVKRNGVTVTTTTQLSYTDSGLSPTTAYSYTVVATDAAGNVSPAAGPLSITTLAQKPGDLNSDGNVDLIDLSILLSNWSSTTSPQYDINGNGVVDIFDLSVLLTNYGT